MNYIQMNNGFIEYQTKKWPTVSEKDPYQHMQPKKAQTSLPTCAISFLTCLGISSQETLQMSRNGRECTFGHVHPAKIQIMTIWRFMSLLTLSESY